MIAISEPPRPRFSPRATWALGTGPCVLELSLVRSEALSAGAPCMARRVV